ncbi:MAG: DUF86 domain-containing protein [Spirochaetaceae bacterium]|nr:DUF86 domain-containing protein [Spirochaetaceae bacterium]
MSDAKIIEKMISLSKKILSYIQNLEYDEFSKKEMIVEACAFNLGQLGELSHKLSAEFKNNYLNIPWKSIYGMRNKIIHDYEGVNLKVVWETVSEDLPQLIEQLEKCIKP